MKVNKISVRHLFVTLLCLVTLQTALAADSLFIQERQIPILIDRIDNVLYELRVEADKGDVLNALTLQFGDEVNMDEIQSVRLFYGGVEAPSRKGQGAFSPVKYISSVIPGHTRQALPSYSVLQD